MVDKNVFATAMDAAGVFRNETALSPEFLPAEMPGRESQFEEIARALAPAAEGRLPSNLFIHGPAGSGKTSACRSVARQLTEYSGKPLVAYVNCWQNSTRQSVLAALAQAAGEPSPRRGVAGDEIYSRAMQQFKRQKRTAIVFLDEADKLFNGKEHEVLYDLSRSAEMHAVPTAVVMITNDSSLVARTEARIRSSLTPTTVEFKPYSPQELKMILSRRAAEAFLPGACQEEAIALCAAFAAKQNGDCRIAIQLLYKAGRNAEKRGSETLGVQDVRQAAVDALSSAQQKRSRDEELLSPGAKNALQMLRENDGMRVNEFYLKFAATHGGSERSARNYLRELEENSFTTETESWEAGGVRHRTIRLKE